MTSVQNTSTATPDDPRQEFTLRLQVLYETAGKPKYDSIATTANTLRGDPRARPLDRRRITDWINGGKIPATWDTTEPFVNAMREKAMKLSPSPPIDGLYDMGSWRRRYHEAHQASEAARKAARRAQSSVDLPCPYRGLAVFEQEHAEQFFGRAAATQELLARVRSAASAGRPLMLMGSSGVGKSSLVRAGLLPCIARGELGIEGSERWPVGIISPGQYPLAQLQDRVRELSGGAATDHPDHMILIVDQAEELFTLADSDQRRATLELLAELSAPAPDGSPPHVLLIVCIRADFYQQCLSDPWLRSAVQDHQMALGAMSAQELREVITRPAEQAQLKVEDGLVEHVLADAGIGATSREQIDVGALPMISQALTETWTHRQAGTVTVKGYATTGGIHSAIETTAERAWAELDDTGQHAADQLVLALVHIGDGHGEPDTRRRVPRDSLIEHSSDPEAAQTALEVLTRARLINTDAGGVQLAHEALLSAWSRLPRLIDQYREQLRLRQRVEQDAAAWDAAEQDPAMLYRGGRLYEAEQWAAAAILDRPSPVASEFVAAATRQRRRRAWSRGIAVAAGLILALLAGVAAIIARTHDRGETFARTLAEADRLAGVDPSLAARLYLVTHQMSEDNTEVDGRLLSTQNSPLAGRLAAPNGAIYDEQYNAQGSLLVTASYNGPIQMWRMRNHTMIGPPLTSGTGYASSASFSPTSHVLAGAGEDGQITLWDVTNPEQPRRLDSVRSPGGEIYLLRWSPDGHLLATANHDSTVTVWDASNPRHLVPWAPPLTGHHNQVRSVGWSHDGRYVASGGDDGAVLVWDVSQAHHSRQVAALPGHTGAVHSVAFSPDSHLLASGADDKTTRLWNIADLAHPQLEGNALSGQRGPIWSVEFSPDGRVLATGSADGTSRLWSITESGALPIPGELAGDGGSVYAIAYSPDGHTLVAGSEDGSTLAWTLPATVLAGHTGRVLKMAISPDGRLLATGGSDDTVRLWDISDPAHPHPLAGPLQGHHGFVIGLAFSPDGHTLATTSAQDGQLRFWDVTDPVHPQPAGAPIPRHTQWAAAAAYSPDGRLLVTTDHDNTAQVWSLAHGAAHPLAVGPELTGHNGYINTISYTPDSQTMATASSDGTVRLWNITDGAHTKLLAVINPHAGQLSQAAISPNGRTLATTGEDKLLRLFDISDPAHPTPITQLRGHSELVSAVAFSPDGTQIVSGSTDNTARVWNLGNTAQPDSGLPLSGHTGGVNSVAVTKDGKYVLTASEDDTIMLWNLSLEHAIRRICATTPGAISPASSRDTRVPYTPTCGDK